MGFGFLLSTGAASSFILVRPSDSSEADEASWYSVPAASDMHCMAAFDFSSSPKPTTWTFIFTSFSLHSRTSSHGSASQVSIPSLMSIISPWRSPKSFRASYKLYVIGVFPNGLIESIDCVSSDIT